MEKYHIIILGAGIAGTSLGIFLKQRGNNDFLILNPLNHNIHKACTGLLTNKTIGLIKELGLSLDGYTSVSSFIANYNGKDIKDYSKSSLSLTHHFTPGRKSLDDALYDMCVNKGINVIENTGNIIIDDKNKYVAYLDKKIAFDYVIDARGFYLDIKNSKHKDIGFEGVVTHKLEDSKLATKIILKDTLKGYGWLNRGPTYDVIGVVDEHHKGINYHDFFLNYVKEEYGEVNDIDIKSAFIPFKVGKLLINKYHAQIGDKAGLVDPLTQEGIYYAMKSAQSVANALSKNDLTTYSKDMKPIVKSFNFAYRIRPMFFSKKFQRWLWNPHDPHYFAQYLFYRYSVDLDPIYYTKLIKYRKQYLKSDYYIKVHGNK